MHPAFFMSAKSARNCRKAFRWAHIKKSWASGYTENTHRKPRPTTPLKRGVCWGARCFFGARFRCPPHGMPGAGGSESARNCREAFRCGWWDFGSYTLFKDPGFQLLPITALTCSRTCGFRARVPGALRVVLPLVLWRWCCGAGAVVLELELVLVLVLELELELELVLVLWCCRWCCGAAAGAVAVGLTTLLPLALGARCCAHGDGARLGCWVPPAAWRAQFPCTRIGCIPHPAQGHRRTRAGHAAYALAPTHKPRAVGSCDNQLVVLRCARNAAWWRLHQH